MWYLIYIQNSSFKGVWKMQYLALQLWRYKAQERLWVSINTSTKLHHSGYSNSIHSFLCIINVRLYQKTEPKRINSTPSVRAPISKWHAPSAYLVKILLCFSVNRKPIQKPVIKNVLYKVITQKKSKAYIHNKGKKKIFIVIREM